MSKKFENSSDELMVGIGQIAPVWLNRKQTLEKIVRFTKMAADKQCQLLVFGEALLPGYPFWIERTDGERVVEPSIEQEELIVATIDHQRVRAKRQNVDPAGHNPYL